MPTTIDSLQIEIDSSSQNASSGVEALANSLDKLKNATKGGVGLSSVAKSMKELGKSLDTLGFLNVGRLKETVDALDGLKALNGVKISSTIAKSIGDIGDATEKLSVEGVVLLSEVAPALSSLSTVGDIKISSTIGKGISEIASAASSVNRADLGKIAELSQAVSSLANLQNIRISSTIANEIVNLGVAAEQMQGIDLSIFGNLAEALHPLSELGRVTNMTSALTQLRRIPEIIQSLDDSTIDAFTEKIQRLTTALQPLASAMQSVSNGFSALPQRIQQVINSTNRLSSSNTRTASTYTELWSKVRMAYTSMKTIGTTIAKWINESNEYIENLNLFNASMGQYAQEAQKYAERVGDLMGIDPSTWMRNQGVFMTLATGFGVASERAYTMSQNLTQLGYDLSSFFNISVDDAMTKLQSGISGELEPLRRLGYDLSEARLKAVALSLGITQTYNSMNQAQKSQLRYYAIMNQVTTAQGDMARTLDAPANQLRVLQAQVTQAARALGNVFIPILNAVLPYAIALAKAIRMVAAAIASLFGFTLPDIDYSGIDSASSGAGDLADNLGNAGGAAKKLKSYLMGFDELNVLNDTDSSGGGGSGGGGGGSDWDWDLPTYDFLDGLVSSRIDGLMKEFQPVFDFIQEHLDEILAIAGAITAELLLWKVARALIPDLGTIKTDLKSILSGVVAAATIVVTAILVYNFDNKFMETGKFGYLIADGLSTALGAFIAGKVVANAFGATAGKYTAGKYTAAATLAISAATSIIAIFDSVKNQGVDGATIATGLWAIVKGAAAGGLFAFAAGASVVGGIAVGGAITLGVGLVVALIAYSLSNDPYKKAIVYGKIALTAAEIKSYAQGMFNFDITSTINLAKTTIENEETAKTSLNTALATFNAGVNKITVGATISPDEANTMLEQLTGENGVIPKLQTLLTEKKTTVEIATSLIPPVSQDGEDISGDLIDSMNLGDEVLSQVGNSIGKRLSDAIQEGVKTGFSNGEDLMVTELNKWLNRISTAVANGKVSGEFSANMKILLSDLNRESFAGVIQSYNDLVSELTTTYTTLEKQAYADAVAYAAGLEQAAAYYDSIGDTVNADKARQALDEVNAQLANWDINGSIQTAVDAAIAPGKLQIYNGFQDIFGGALAQFDQTRPFTGLAQDALNGCFDDANADELVDGVKRRVEAALKEAMGDDYQVAVSMKNTLNLTDWDLFSADVQAQMFQAFSDAFGESKAWDVLNKCGYDMTGVLANGIASGSFLVTDEAGNLVVTLKDGTKVALGKYDDGIVKLFNSLGCNIVDGMVLGIDGQMSDEAKALADLFGIPYEKAAEENEVHSPSELFKRLGGYIVEGLISGLGTLYTKLKDTWTTLPTWFQNFINIIVSKFTGMNADVGQLFGDTKSGIEGEWSQENFSGIGDNAVLGLIAGLTSEELPELQPMVSLLKNGWETVTKWVNLFFGNTSNDEKIALLKDAWTTVTSWVHSLFGDTDNDESISLLRLGWETVTKWIHGLFGNTDNDESISLLRLGWTTVTGWINSLFGNTSNDESVSLLQSGWTTVTSWINGFFGNTSNDEGIGLFKSLWTTVSDWVNGRKGSTSVTQEIGVTQSSIWTTVSAWVKSKLGSTAINQSVGLVPNLWTFVSLWVSALLGNTAVNQSVDLKKGNWDGNTIAGWCADSSSLVVSTSLKKGNWAGQTIAGWCADSSSLSVSVSLVKSGWSSLSSWISSSWSKNFTIGLSKGTAVTWTGKLTTTGSTATIRFYKDGGLPPTGQMFVAREAGPELVGSIGNRSAVANNDQIVDAVAEGVYGAVSAAMNGQGGDEAHITINLDGKTIYENQQKIARGRGYNLGMGAFSFG